MLFIRALITGEYNFILEPYRLDVTKRAGLKKIVFPQEESYKKGPRRGIALTRGLL